jgi:hypothetical protein
MKEDGEGRDTYSFLFNLSSIKTCTMVGFDFVVCITRVDKDT